MDCVLYWFSSERCKSHPFEFLACPHLMIEPQNPNEPVDAASNPYANNSNTFSVGVQQGDGYVRQIPIIGTLTLFQGVLELLLASFLLILTVMLAVAVQQGEDLQGIKSEISPIAMMIGYGIVSAFVGCCSILRIVSGIQTLRRRGRILTIVSSIAGLVTVMTGCCSITSLALAVYTLIVLVQPSVIDEYERHRSEK